MVDLLELFSATVKEENKSQLNKPFNQHSNFDIVSNKKLFPWNKKVLGKKVLILGPRKSGKTTLILYAIFRLKQKFSSFRIYSNNNPVYQKIFFPEENLIVKWHDYPCLYQDYPFSSNKSDNKLRVDESKLFILDDINQLSQCMTNFRENMHNLFCKNVKKKIFGLFLNIPIL